MTAGVCRMNNVLAAITVAYDPLMGASASCPARQTWKQWPGSNGESIGDVVEVAPPYDQTGNTALVGASIMFEILCLVADSNFGARSAGEGRPASRSR